jgi:hypothetical protein
MISLRNLINYLNRLNPFSLEKKEMRYQRLREDDEGLSSNDDEGLPSKKNTGSFVSIASHLKQIIAEKLRFVYNYFCSKNKKVSSEEVEHEFNFLAGLNREINTLLIKMYKIKNNNKVDLPDQSEHLKEWEHLPKYFKRVYSLLKLNDELNQKRVILSQEEEIMSFSLYINEAMLKKVEKSDASQRIRELQEEIQYQNYFLWFIEELNKSIDYKYNLDNLSISYNDRVKLGNEITKIRDLEEQKKEERERLTTEMTTSSNNNVEAIPLSPLPVVNTKNADTRDKMNADARKIQRQFKQKQKTLKQSLMDMELPQIPEDKVFNGGEVRKIASSALKAALRGDYSLYSLAGSIEANRRGKKYRNTCAPSPVESASRGTEIGAY